MSKKEIIPRVYVVATRPSTSSRLEFVWKVPDQYHGQKIQPLVDRFICDPLPGWTISYAYPPN